MREDMNEMIREKIQNADLVLVGIGEEFEGMKYVKQIPEYVELREQAETFGKEWMIPYLNRYFLLQDQSGYAEQLKKSLVTLSDMLKGKNYFAVTIITNDLAWDADFKENRLVAPCGGSRMKQCEESQKCKTSPLNLTNEDQQIIEKCIRLGNLEKIELGSCPECEARMILNNIYTESYDERGYLDLWQKYTKWLQGTLNKKLCILELGVGMQCPGVIRFPFEKIGYFNQKADFIRVNQNLYQLTEELKEKGISISENAVDWLASMC